MSGPPAQRLIAVLRSRCGSLSARPALRPSQMAAPPLGTGPGGTGVPIMTTQDRTNVYARITAEIIAAIEAGAGEWRMPWHHDGSSIARPTNVSSGKVYRGVNTLALWIAAQTHGFGSGIWGTYRQWQAINAQVRKGERATTVVLWKEVAARDDDSGVGDEETAQRRLFARAFSVFNSAQVDGFTRPAAPILPDSEHIPHAEAFIAALGIPVTFGANAAYYRIDLDRIFMPNFSAFHDAVAHIGTHVHEAAHATGAEHRLDRDFSTRFTRQALAVEELTAELTAAYVLADLGVPTGNPIRLASRRRIG
jgi:antirestriction protein ArdC